MQKYIVFCCNKLSDELIRLMNFNGKTRYSTNKIEVHKHIITLSNKPTTELINLINCNGEYHYNANNIKEHIYTNIQ